MEWLALNRPPTLDYELFSWGLSKLWCSLTVGGAGEADQDDASG